jgi:4-diphosphocytidyl-2-C-methyl-D-erythritol kinase
MQVTARSFAKINLGLRIGPLRTDRFHELRTVYQTIALHDVIHVEVQRGSGIEIRCDDPRVPDDGSNTCYKIVERAMTALGARGRVVVTIQKRLPVQGGLGGASANAAVALLALEGALKKMLPAPEKLRIAAEVGSDLPLFLIGGTVLGVGHGEEVYPLPDLPSMPCVVAIPEIGVSTPKAFADWDRSCGAGALARESVELRSTWTGQRPVPTQSISMQSISRQSVPTQSIPMQSVPTQIEAAKLTQATPSDRISEFSHVLSAWLISQSKAGKVSSGVFAKNGGRAGNPLLDLVRTGIENDFEQVVFPQYPELREVKSVLLRAGAFYASLSGSGSATYGVFASRTAAEKAAVRLRKGGIPTVATTTMTRQQYWKKIFD